MTSKLKVNILADGGDNAIMTSNGSGTLTLNNAALKNTPAFLVKLSGNQSVSDDVATKASINEVLYESSSGVFDTTNYKFLPTVAGTYCFMASVEGDCGSSTFQDGTTQIYKNGSAINVRGFGSLATNYGNQVGFTVSLIAEANGTTDYFELYGRVNDTSGTPSFNATGTYMMGYKLIGA